MRISITPRQGEPGNPRTHIEPEPLAFPMQAADWLAACMTLLHAARQEAGSMIPAAVSEYLDNAADSLGDAAGALAEWSRLSEGLGA